MYEMYRQQIYVPALNAQNRLFQSNAILDKATWENVFSNVQPRRNLAVGDIVISKESESTRNKWPLGKVVQVYPSDDGSVREVRLPMADGNLDDSGKRQRPPSYLDRPIHKLVLLLTADEMFQEDVFNEETREVPIEEPTKNNWKTLQRFYCQ